MGSRILRFCNNCGKEMQVVPVRFLEMFKGSRVYEVRCIKGHNISATTWGANIIVSSRKLKLADEKEINLHA